MQNIRISISTDKTSYLFFSFFFILDCSDPPSFSGVTTNFTTTTHGSTAAYSCDVGYVEDSGDVSISCDAGVWTGTPLQCTTASNKIFHLTTRHGKSIASLYIYCCIYIMQTDSQVFVGSDKVSFKYNFVLLCFKESRKCLD